MKNSSQEVELKLPLSDKEKIIQKLTDLKATFVSEVTQKDYLYDSNVKDFAKSGEALRIRHETSAGEEKIYVTYKGPATFSKEGHKIREEYEVEVSDFSSMQKIISALQYTEVGNVEKKRLTYHLNNIIVAIDTLPFGTFIELEGDAIESEALRQQLTLGNVEPIKKGYMNLQIDWEIEQKKK